MTNNVFKKEEAKQPYTISSRPTIELHNIGASVSFKAGTTFNQALEIAKLFEQILNEELEKASKEEDAKKAPAKAEPAKAPKKKAVKKVATRMKAEKKKPGRKKKTK